ncbi:MAG TPA: glycosyltransferase [Candidatus Saccharimonadales bacterium]|nr:glycosyltransferase [Candidatus Saccharimonadales bacterium]
MTCAVSAILPTWNGEAMLRRCLPSVCAALSAAGGEVVVIENGSTDGSLELLRREFPGVRVLRNERNEGFTRAINQGLREARGRRLLLLNNDVVLTEAALRGLLEFMDRPEHARVGAVSPRLVGQDGRRQQSCMSFPTLGSAILDDFQVHRLWPGNPVRRRDPLVRWDYRDTAAVDHAMAACLLVRREAAEQAGPLDERMRILRSDLDWSWAMARAGWTTYYCYEVSVVHLGSHTIKRPDRALRIRMYLDNYLYYRKHFGWRAWPMLVPLGVRAVVARLRFPARSPQSPPGRFPADLP